MSGNKTAIIQNGMTGVRFGTYQAKIPRARIVLQILLDNREHMGMIIGSLAGALLLGVLLVLPMQTVGMLETGRWEYGIATWLLVAMPALILFSIVPDEYRQIERDLRLQLFAMDNNFDYLLQGGTSDYPGVIFGEGHSRRYDNVVNGTFQGLPFEFGNFRYVTGSGKNRREHWHGVLGIRLNRRLPHVLLDSKGNNRFGFSNLPAFSRDQRLELEGDFNKYFDLYVPKGYERDALYFLTPELMQLLVDHGSKFDVELVDDFLFIYGNGPFSLEKQETVESLLGLVSVVGKEVEENTGRYADQRIGMKAADIVAEPGRRLKQLPISVATIVGLAVWSAFMLLPLGNRNDWIVSALMVTVVLGAVVVSALRSGGPRL